LSVLVVLEERLLTVAAVAAVAVLSELSGPELHVHSHLLVQVICNEVVYTNPKQSAG
jgi:hypothetical protein